ncbi:MAG TPA: thiamine pyrophosphate-dependent enzyme [Candidatus Limnocylindria bacterium]|jgi:pyruvate/2-oxoglutarate/acetoin dehydrogenase E1 component/TPP-dependent pyruvate/acetoin dehydrogenase alpha subunit
MKTGERPATTITTPRAKVTLTREQVIADYRLAVRSRAASELGRREVLIGRAPFGIFGDGKEIANLGMAHAFRPGDWRSGYYRDQTFMLAVGVATLEQYFAQLYADADLGREPFSGGRQMSNHYATRTVDEHGRWRDLLATGQTASDLSPVGAQMPRSVGLAWASKLYRTSPGLRGVSGGFSRNGDEVCFCTIGNAGTSEGLFWEAINAAGVLQVPLVVGVWDDGYGISVPNAFQTTKGSISAALAGMQRDGGPGFEIRVAKGWDYVGLIDTFAEVTELARRDHVPSLVHVVEVTQPQGHSTSGSHERYKPAERLRFEVEGDPIRRMREWMIRDDIADAATLDEYERRDRADVEAIRERAYETSQAPMLRERDEAAELIELAADEAGEDLAASTLELRRTSDPNRALIDTSLFGALVSLRAHRGPARDALATFASRYRRENLERYSSHLLSASDASPLRVAAVPPRYAPSAVNVDGRVVLLRCFDDHLARDPRIVILGEDVGILGDVNLVYEGLQAKYGTQRVIDTGIREATILGQGIGAAMRGLRPIVDIQYVDYLLYALEIASDDLATLRHRTAGGQQAPVVIRTKGHRLQGIWHTGSPMQLILGALRGMHVCVPRDMTQAAGFYNTLLRGDDPALVIEVLSGYRLKERVPENVAEFTLPLGVPETIRAGRDITVVTYGALCRIALEAAGALASAGIDIEIVDVRTLLPFDTDHLIAASVKRTGALLVVDEDLPGGASAYILQQVLDSQRAIDHLDVPARALSATAARTPVGTDADHFTKPGRDDIFAAAYAIARERDPDSFPSLFGDGA